MIVRGTGLGGTVNSYGKPRPAYNESIFYGVEKDTRPAPVIKEIKAIPLKDYLKQNTSLNVSGGNDGLIVAGVVGLIIILILRG